MPVEGARGRAEGREGSPGEATGDGRKTGAGGRIPDDVSAAAVAETGLLSRVR